MYRVTVNGCRAANLDPAVLADWLATQGPTFQARPEEPNNILRLRVMEFAQPFQRSGK
jgi:hypothetical protein